MAREKQMFGEGLRRLALSLAVTLVVALGLAPGIGARVALADGEDTYTVRIDGEAIDEQVTSFPYGLADPRAFGEQSVEGEPATVSSDPSVAEVRWDSSSRLVSITIKGPGKAFAVAFAAERLDYPGQPINYIQKTYDILVTKNTREVSLGRDAASVGYGDKVALTATVSPKDATDRTVKWDVQGDAVTLYSDEACQTPVALNTATPALTVYAKGAKVDTAKVTVTSNADATKSAICEVIVTEKAEPAPAPEPTPDPDPDPDPESVVTDSVARVAMPSAVGAAASRSFKLSWKAADGAKKYQVQWRAAGGKWQRAVTAKGKSHVVKGLKTGTAYEFRVRGVNGDVRGAWSSPARRWLKSASKVRAAAGKQPGTIRVTWAKDARANAGHEVYVYARRGGGAVKTVVVAKGKAAVTIEGLKAGKTYHVRMRPVRRASGNTFSGLICGYRAVKAAK